MSVVDIRGNDFRLPLEVPEHEWKSRIELKMSMSDSQFWSLISTGSGTGVGSSLFPERAVESVYFETVNFDNFYNSEEGLLPRLKIRLRSYNDSQNFCLLELKESTAFGRRKISIPVDRDKMSVKELRYRGIAYKPVLVVRYSRKYFSVSGMRATRDTDICFSDVFGLRLVRCSEIVHEIKYGAALPPLHFDTEHPFGFASRRFSKFCSAVSGLGLR